MPYNNEYNRMIANDVMKLNKRYLEHEKKTGQLSGGFLGALAGMLMPTLVSTVANKIFGGGEGEMPDVADYQFGNANKEGEGYSGGALGGVGGFSSGTFMDTGFDRTIGSGMSAGVKKYEKMEGGTLLGNGECSCGGGMSGGKGKVDKQLLELNKKLKGTRSKCKEDKSELSTKLKNKREECKTMIKDQKDKVDTYRMRKKELGKVLKKKQKQIKEEEKKEKEMKKQEEKKLMENRKRRNKLFEKKEKEEKKEEKKKTKKFPINLDWDNIGVPEGYEVLQVDTGDITGDFLVKDGVLFSVSKTGKLGKRVGTEDETGKITWKESIIGKGRMTGGNVSFPRVPVANMKASYMAGQGRSGGGRGKRAEIVKKIMGEKGLSMIEASKYVKQHNLY